MKHFTNYQAPDRAEAAIKKRKWFGRLSLFCGISVYLELGLHLFVFHSADLHIVYPVLFGLMTGTVTALIASVLPRIPQRIAAVLLVLLQCVLAETQLIYHAVFGNLMPISQVAMGGGVITEFLGQTLYAIGQNILPVLLLLLPLPALVIVMVRKGLRDRLGWRQTVTAPILLIVLLGGTIGLMRLACRHPVSVWRQFRDAGTSTDLSYRNVGMTATTLQEIRYLLHGSDTQSSMEDWDRADPADSTDQVYDPAEWNVLPGLDFQALASSTEDPTLAALDHIFARKEPSRKNEYTGRLRGYNVIVLCAESYSPLFVSEELTPTLYRMSHSGLVFENYYGTFNSITTNGEYTTCLSLYPDMTRNKSLSSFDVSVGHYLPFCLGRILKNYGYTTLAYHNNNGEFYNRSQTHPNMGYTFRAQGSGLEVTPQRPASDLEMMEASVDDYLNSDGPFHAYYMTYSGHYQYNWDNAMSAKHRNEVEDLPYSDTVKAYVACNLEVEYALSYLEQRLDQAGKLDNTLIVLTNDHYPYGLSEGQYNELAGGAIDVNFEKFHNHFICYAPGLGETVSIRTYCSTADVLPTVLNLLGVDYDSRLLAGTDVLSDGRHAAVLYDGSFITDGFRYCESTGELIIDPGVEVDAQTLQEYRDWVADKFTYSREILNTDYYSHVFPNHDRAETSGLEIPFDDIVSVRVQGNILFIYRKGLMDLYAEREFAPHEAGTVGDFVTAIYRHERSPETSEAYLPEDYLADRENGMQTLRECPQYEAVCWAFEKGLLRADDRVMDYTTPLTNVEICLLLYRTHALLGETDLAVDPAEAAALEVNNTDMTDAEREAVVWCLNHRIIRGDGTQSDMFSDSEENIVSRYRVVLFLLHLFYPQIV